MVAIPLIAGAYQSRSVIAEAQRCLNLYAEGNPKDAEQPYTYYPTPGLRRVATAPTIGPFRGLYWTTNSTVFGVAKGPNAVGALYGVVANKLYLISPGWVFTELGTLFTFVDQVYMIDNGISLVVTDGSDVIYTVNLATNVFSILNFIDGVLQTDRVDFIDTFLVFNHTNTREFYSSLSNIIAPFDPTYVAQKTAFPDNLISLCVVNRQIWLLGALTSEVWYDTGGQDFPFAIVPGIFVPYGTCAENSVARHGDMLFWLSQDKDGNREVVLGQNYQAKRISTHAIETQINKYSVVSDAIGMCYQQEGHPFYLLTFPTADKTWVFDVSSGLWHERAWIDLNGQEHRHRANCMVMAYGRVVCGDWENGKLYQLDLDVYTDDGLPITRRRSFPHIVKDGDRVSYAQFIADMEAGGVLGDPADSPSVSLRWSDDRGRTFGNALEQTLGTQGNYIGQASWNRLGMARDRVFELSWSFPGKTALNGAWVDPRPLGS